MAREKGGFWVWFAATFLYPICRLLARRINRGTEHLPRTGGALLVMNHVSHLDPLYDAVFVHKLRRVPHFLAKDSLFRPFLVGRVMYGTGQIPVYRGTTDAKDSLRDANQALAEGKVVVIYPEGTVTRDPGHWPMYARTGVARLALENDVPVLPAARYGTQEIVDVYAKKFHFVPRGRVTTVIGAPVDLSEFRPADGVASTKTLREVTDLLMVKVTELEAEIRGETPPTEVFRPPARSPKPSAAPSTETAPESAADPDVARDVAADVPPDVAAEGAPDVAAGGASNVAADAAPDGAPDVAVDAAADAAPDVAADAAPAAADAPDATHVPDVAAAADADAAVGDVQEKKDVREKKA